MNAVRLQAPASASRTMNRPAPAFTLIELVTVIVILGVLSTVAIPVYLDYTRDAKVSACKGALGALRAAVGSYHAWSATDAGGGVPRYPAINDLTTVAVVIQDAVPPNPFDSDGTPNNVVNATGTTKGTIVGNAGGWCYNPTNGQVWANTGTKGVGESAF